MVLRAAAGETILSCPVHAAFLEFILVPDSANLKFAHHHYNCHHE